MVGGEAVARSRVLGSVVAVVGNADDEEVPPLGALPEAVDEAPQLGIEVGEGVALLALEALIGHVPGLVAT